MINVRAGPSSIIITGHANYAPLGKDIICAAVTALTQTLICSVSELTGDDISYNDISPDEVDIHLENLSDKAQLLVDSFLVGVKMIADDFPDNVRVEIKGRNGLGRSEWTGARKEEKE